MKEVKILEVEKEVLKRIDMICRFACCKYTIKQGSNIAYVSPHIITIKENKKLKIYVIINNHKGGLIIYGTIYRKKIIIL